MTETSNPIQTSTSDSSSDSATEIARRLAGLKPRTLSEGQRATMFEDLCDAVMAAGPNHFEEARQWLTYLAGFIHDTAPGDSCDLWTVLTDTNISAWVNQGIVAGKPRHTLSSRRGVLTRILIAHRGVAVGRATQKKRGPSAAPLRISDALSLLEACEKDSRSALRGYVAHVGAGVPRGTRKVRFSTAGAHREVGNAVTTWRIAPLDLDPAELDGEFLIEEDRVALTRIAQDLGYRLSDGVVNQTFRTLAVADDELTLSERFVTYRLYEATISAVAQHLKPLTMADYQSHLADLRNG